LEAGDGDSSGGSESEPSEDNLPIDKASEIIPITEKKDLKLLQKLNAEKKKKEAKEKELRDAAARNRAAESPRR